MKISELGSEWFSAYEHSLRHYKVKEAAAIAKYYRPRKLYKYYSFSSKYWKDNVYSGQLAFSFPSNFNDPFDSRWFLDYERIYRERFLEINEEWTIEKFGGKEFFENCVHLNEEDLLYLRYMFCICCFSETPYSNLMWGHYANKHTGFCLEYDLECLPKKLQLIMPIVYTSVPFDASMILDMRGIDDKYAPICPLLFKSTDWSYEKEWRIICPSENPDSIPVISTSGAVSGIYFGFNSYCPERDELEKWAEASGIPSYQIERSHMSFDFISESTKEIKRSGKHSGLFV